MTRRIGIIGAGSFGIALAHLLTENGHSITMWTRSEEHRRMLEEAHGDPEKLPGVTLPPAVRFTCALGEALEGVDAAVLVVPSIHIRETVQGMRPHLAPGTLVVDCAKGIEEGTLRTLSEVIAEELADAAEGHPGGPVQEFAAEGHPEGPSPEIAAEGHLGGPVPMGAAGRPSRIVVLSGPSHAEEVGRDMPTAIVAASSAAEDAGEVQDIFMSPCFRVYTSGDVRGVELGGALKNVIALAAGMADGLGYGDNTKAAMITRGMAEITRLGLAMGAEAATFSGLAGMGDLIVTCASMHSRNRRAGILIGQGYSVAEAVAQVRMVVEGINSARAAYLLAQRHGVSMPIITEVYRILYEGKRPAQAVAELMRRDKRSEH